MQNFNSNNPEKSLNDCNEKSSLDNILENLDSAQGNCEDLDSCNKTNMAGPDLSWLEEHNNQKTGFGSGVQCDPMLTGNIINNTNDPNLNTIYRYSSAIRGCDEAVMDMFRNVVCIDDDGKAHKVPLMFGTQERAVAFAIQDNVRKDNSLVVDRIRLPIMSLANTGIQFNIEKYAYHKATDYLRYKRTDGKPGFTTSEKYDRDTVFGVTKGIPVNITYTLYAWTLYLEDMNQILEQIILKFSPIAYIKIRGINWEVIVKLDSIGNNIENEPGDQALRVIKYQFDLTAESFIPQPIVRNKAVLKTKIDLVTQDEDEIIELINTLEESVKGYE
jgi:hypothetical protein